MYKKFCKPSVSDQYFVQQVITITAAPTTTTTTTTIIIIIIIIANRGYLRDKLQGALHNYMEKKLRK